MTKPVYSKFDGTKGILKMSGLEYSCKAILPMYLYTRGLSPGLFEIMRAIRIQSTPESYKS